MAGSISYGLSCRLFEKVYTVTVPTFYWRKAAYIHIIYSFVSSTTQWVVRRRASFPNLFQQELLTILRGARVAGYPVRATRTRA